MSSSVLLKHIKLLERTVTKITGQWLIDRMVELFVKSQLIGNLETFRTEITDERLYIHHFIMNRRVNLQFSE